MNLIKIIKNKWKRIFRKRLKANKHPKIIEIVAGGYVSAPDYMCTINEKTNKKR